jgi:hypothetical protein
MPAQWEFQVLNQNLIQCHFSRVRKNPGFKKKPAQCFFLGFFQGWKKPGFLKKKTSPVGFFGFFWFFLGFFGFFWVFFGFFGFFWVFWVFLTGREGF